jgi:hypothetical protein
MTATAMSVSAVAVCCIGWLAVALVLILDVLGRPLARRRFGARARRRDLMAGLAMMTGVVFLQVAELRNWARPLRESLDLLVVFLALVVLGCVVAGLASRQRKSQQQ